MRCEGGINGLGQAGDRKPCGPRPGRAGPARREVLPPRRPEVLGQGGHLRTLRTPARRRLPPGARTARGRPRGRSRRWAPTRSASTTSRRGSSSTSPTPSGSRSSSTSPGPSTAASSRARRTWRAAATAVREAARACKGHPALLALSVVNEVPADVVRWLGREKVERFIDELVAIAHEEDPEVLVTFASFPPTEYLHPTTVDFYTMNVYLHRREKFRVLPAAPAEPRRREAAPPRRVRHRLDPQRRGGAGGAPRDAPRGGLRQRPRRDLLLLLHGRVVHRRAPDHRLGLRPRARATGRRSPPSSASRPSTGPRARSRPCRARRRSPSSSAPTTAARPSTAASGRSRS